MAIDPERHSRVNAMLREAKLDALICSAPDLYSGRRGSRASAGR
jgi:hypothetical protein